MQLKTILFLAAAGVDALQAVVPRLKPLPHHHIIMAESLEERPEWSPKLTTSDLIVSAGSTNGVRYWQARWPAPHQIGRRNVRPGSKHQACDDCEKNLLAYEEEDSELLKDPAAERFLADAKILREGGTLPRRRTLATLSVATNLQARRLANGRTILVQPNRGQDARTVTRIKVDADSIAAKEGQLKDYLEIFAVDAQNDPAGALSHLMEQAEALQRIQWSSAKAHREKRIRDQKVKFDEKWMTISERCGWYALEGEVLRVECPEAAFLGCEACPLFADVQASFFDSSKVGPRGQHDADLEAYRDVLNEYRDADGNDGYETIILKRIPLLAARLEENKDNLERLEEYKKVLEYLADHSQVDHIWSSATDHPKNCRLLRPSRGLRPSVASMAWGLTTSARVRDGSYAIDATHGRPRAGYLEFDVMNNHFKNFNNQPAKLEHYGKIADEVSTDWMSDSIDAEADAIELEFD